MERELLGTVFCSRGVFEVWGPQDPAGDDQQGLRFVADVLSGRCGHGASVVMGPKYRVVPLIGDVPAAKSPPPRDKLDIPTTESGWRSADLHVTDLYMSNPPEADPPHVVGD